jgi:hypothetical protein
MKTALAPLWGSTLAPLFRAAMYTICDCCGSKVLTKDGKIQGLGAPVDDWRKIAEAWGYRLRDYMNFNKNDEAAAKLSYERDNKDRFTFRDAPGIFVGPMKMSTLLKHVYTEDAMKVAEGWGGVEIHDPDLGWVSFSWLNK